MNISENTTKAPPRNIAVVIGQIKEKLPDNKPEFVKRLDWIITDSQYKAPEDQVVCWNHLGTALQEFIPPRNVDKKWQCEAISIFSTKPLEEVMKHFNVVE